MRARWFIWFGIATVVVFSMFLAGQRPAAGAPEDPQACPDIAPTITLDPPAPKPGEPVTITVTIANRGTADVGGFYTYLYVDPADQPPNASTPDTSSTRSIGLPASWDYSWSLTSDEFFTEPGSHVVYAWSDRDNQIGGECSETNNLASVVVNVGSCAADGFESPGDNTCSTARLVTTDGSTKRHTLCPTGDEDWIRFEGQAGLTYQIVAGNVEQDADLVLNYYASCSDPALAHNDPSFGTGVSLDAPVFANGTYYVQVKHTDALYGDATGYDLSIKALCSADEHEIDDRCALARELTAGTAAQIRSFCRRGDEDWVSLPVTGGKSYRLATSAWEGKSQPVIELYQGCQAQPFLSAAARAPLEWQATDTGVLLARIRNSNAQEAGLNTGYQLALVETSPAASDPEEPNDSLQAAKPLAAGEAQQLHFSTPGDQDWLRFDAVAGQRYRIETFDLTSTDTVLCLYNQSGTLVQCDDDSGQGLGSRLHWQAPAAGVYYLRAYDAAPDRGGPDAAYRIELNAADAVCDPDAQEPDEALTLAREVQANGQPVQHTFCPGGDTDWARVAIGTPGVYDIRVEAMGADADPLFTLYDRDGQTVLFENDDYGPGLSARILWRFQNAGVYYLRVSSFDGQAAGRGAEYRIRIAPSAEQPTPTPLPPPTPTLPPTPTPLPTPTLSWPVPVPTPNGPAQVLLVTNRQRLETLYDAAGADLVMSKLAQLVAYPYAPGLLLNLDGDVNTMRAYADWQAQIGDVRAANRVTDAIRGQIGVYLEQHPTIQYVVLVGGDDVIPFRRVRDSIYGRQEKDYLPEMNKSAMGQALQQNMSLVDDFYVALDSKTVMGEPFYLPERAIARLVETPQQIAAYIDRFFADGGGPNPYSLNLDKLNVVAADVPQDSALALCRRLQPQLQQAMDCYYAGNPWGRAEFLNKYVVNADPGMQLLATRGQHWNIRTPDLTTIDGSELAGANARLSDGVVVAGIQHGGLNVSAADPYAVDLPEVYLSITGIYVSSTGWALYSHKADNGFTGKLLNLFVEQMFFPPQSDHTPTAGEAWLRAKQSYWQQTRNPTEADRKVLHTAVLYGLPMYRITGTLTDEYKPFPSVRSGGSLVTAAAGALAVTDTVTLDLALANSFQSLQLTTTVDGSYYELDAYADVSSQVPVQPQYYTPLSALGEFTPGRYPRGVLWTGGVYTDVRGFDPLIPQVAVEGAADAVEALAAPLEAAAAKQASAWDYAVLGQLDAGGEQFAVTWGQFNAAGATERIYDELTFEFTFSDVDDTLAPSLVLAGAQANRIAPQVKIEASDASGIKRVLVVYSDNRGAVHSLALKHRPDMNKWVGEIPTTTVVDWFAYIVDGAGNVATVTNKGGFFTAGSGRPRFAPQYLYLPAISR